jgi:hypothetical protein
LQNNYKIKMWFLTLFKVKKVDILKYKGRKHSKIYATMFLNGQNPQIGH